MKDAARQTRTYLMRLFKKHGFNPRTDLGQNFLIDLNIVEYIVERAHLDERDVVLEVGSGTGGMTTFLAQQAAAVVSVEYDSNMYQLAREATADLENVTLMNCDALKNKNNLAPAVIEKIEEKLAEEPGRRLKLISNLPFNIATPIVSNLVATNLPWERMVVTIQLELGQRMASRPNESQYGALPVWLQAQCWVKFLKRLPPTVFWPRPQVFSAIVQLVPNISRRRSIEDRPFFHDFVRRLFQQRRKFLRSVAVGMYRKELSKPEVDQILAEANIITETRAEQLDVDTLVDLSNRFYRVLSKEAVTE